MYVQAHFVHLSTRDEALARSLNADYVAQVQIFAPLVEGLFKAFVGADSVRGKGEKKWAREATQIHL